MNKESGTNEPFDLKVISQTKKPSGGETTTYLKDGTTRNEPYGEIITTQYECPCGKGKVVLIEEAIPGYYDFFTRFECAECKEKYELLWGKGVIPGHSPMTKKRHSKLSNAS